MKPLLVAATHADPWAPEVVDFEALNATAADAIVQSLEDLRRRALEGAAGGSPKVFVAVGPAGVGKTHLFGRLRRKLGPRAMLVHIRPLIGAEMTPRFVLGQIVQQLGYDSYGHRQIDVVAGVALAVATGQSPRYPAATLAELRELEPAERTQRIEQALEALAERHPDLDTGYLERLFRVPFAGALVRNASLVWLGGREPDEAQAARLGVREALPDAAVISALRTLAVVASIASPLLVVFDQLENLIDQEGTGKRILAYGALVSELVDVVRDLVIVQTGLSSEWAAGIEPRLGATQRTRVIGEKIPLALPTPEQCRSLLQLWIGRIERPEAPFPWPFTEGQLAEVCGAVGMTPRMLLLELRRVLEGGEPLAADPAMSSSPDDSLEAAWTARQAAARAHLDEMDRLGSGLEPAFFADGLVAIAALVPALGPIRVERPELVRLGDRIVALVHETASQSVRARLRQLSNLDGNVLALRERWREWPPTWTSTREQWEGFRRRPSVRWLWLERDEATQALAAAALLKDARSADLSRPDGQPIALAVVEEWMRRRLAPEGWILSRALRGELEREVDAAPPPAAGSSAAARPVSPGSSAADRPAQALLRTLRVVSLERLVRELKRSVPGAVRSSVLAELRANPAVRWIGETIVCLEE